MNIIENLKKIVLEFPVYVNELLVTNSSALYGIGIIKDPSDIGDIDIALNGKSWRLISEKYPLISTSLTGQKIDLRNMYCKSSFSRPIEFYNSIGHGFKFRQCFKDSIKIDGFHFMNPIDVMEWNYRMGREKDLRRNKIIKEYLKGKED